MSPIIVLMRKPRKSTLPRFTNYSINSGGKEADDSCVFVESIISSPVRFSDFGETIIAFFYNGAHPVFVLCEADSPDFNRPGCFTSRPFVQRTTLTPCHPPNIYRNLFTYRLLIRAVGTFIYRRISP